MFLTKNFLSKNIRNYLIEQDLTELFDSYICLIKLKNSITNNERLVKYYSEIITLINVTYGNLYNHMQQNKGGLLIELYSEKQRKKILEMIFKDFKNNVIKFREKLLNKLQIIKTQENKNLISEELKILEKLIETKLFKN